MRTGVRFIVTLLLASVAWAVLVGPSYDRMVAVTAGLALRNIETQRMTGSISVDGSRTVVSHVPPFDKIPDQRLELRTHHNNVPLLVALILATPGLVGRDRWRALLTALAALWVLHVLYFMLSVQFHYAFFNVGPYRVQGLRYLNASLAERLSNGAVAAKLIVFRSYDFCAYVGRRLAPILLWMIVCRKALMASVRGLSRTPA